MIRHVPNILTLLRIAFIPLIIFCIHIEPENFGRTLAALFFLAASATDFFDGIIARKFSSYSKFGEVLDPIADKLLVSCTILTLLKLNYVDLMPSIIIISRELIISAIREMLAGKKIDLKVTFIAKVKTAMQMAAIFFLILGSKASSIEIIDNLGRLLIWASSLITFYTAILYISNSIKYFKD